MSATSTVHQVRVSRTEAPRHPGRPARPVGCLAARAAAPRPAPVGAAAPGPVLPARPTTRLTGRGRLTVVAVLVLLLLAAFSLGRTGAEGATTAPAVAQVEQTTVLPGDTLWAVAQRVAPGEDPRPVIDQLRELNELASPELQAGQQLLLPVPP